MQMSSNIVIYTLNFLLFVLYAMCIYAHRKMDYAQGFCRIEVSHLILPLLSQPPCAAWASCLQRRPLVFPCLAQGCWFRSTSHSSDTSGIVSCSQLALCICSSRPVGFCKRLSHRATVKRATRSDSYAGGEKSVNLKQPDFTRA